MALLINERLFRTWTKTFLPDPNCLVQNEKTRYEALPWERAQHRFFFLSPLCCVYNRRVMKLNGLIATIIVLGALAVAGSAHAIVFGQVDDFQDGTLQGWDNGGAGAPPVLNINTGGPAGVNDNFMQVTSVGGTGPGRFLTVFNRSQWLGDYITTGVSAIEMDLRNLGTVNLTIRLAFKDGTGPGAAGYLSQGFSLAAGSGWQHFVFSINQATMTAVGAPAPFNSFFSTGLGEARIINEAGTGNLNGDTVVAQLGVDNIHAVPEPSAVALTSIGGMLAFIAARRRKRV
jgi:hypothetical protein